ncbi:hypothetical protein [Bariatricus sp. SGI.161]
MGNMAGVPDRVYYDTGEGVSGEEREDYNMGKYYSFGEFVSGEPISGFFLVCYADFQYYCNKSVCMVD